MESRNNLFIATATSHDALPPDVLFDVLLRFPAKEICRLRAVCRTWRSLPYDPTFAKAHMNAGELSGTHTNTDGH
ncbi:hypothetical protein HU200_033297 [Digitaria exilis]|uniref:F-box domain-containing protein n=1 Tax=Digitaria exilis TaxID=1010633 RepID=A0A835BS65_9POAL|nr:hypothetical protein HU200_033297 [Digitaria exilis]